jgi:hypothetical protein
MRNPFMEDDSGATDERLAALGQSGDRQALEQLVLRHQPWIYNLVARMLWSTSRIRAAAPARRAASSTEDT